MTVDAKTLQRKLRKIDKWLQDFSSPLREIQKMQLQEVKESFPKSWVNTVDKKWRALSPATVAEKVRKGFSSKPLIRTGALQKSFTKTSVKPKIETISSTSPYFKYHQQWTSKMPQRQILGHWRNLIKQAEKIFTKYIINLIK